MQSTSRRSRLVSVTSRSNHQRGANPFAMAFSKGDVRGRLAELRAKERISLSEYYTSCMDFLVKKWCSSDYGAKYRLILAVKSRGRSGLRGRRGRRRRCGRIAFSGDCLIHSAASRDHGPSGEVLHANADSRPLWPHSIHDAASQARATSGEALQRCRSAVSRSRCSGRSSSTGRRRDSIARQERGVETELPWSQLLDRAAEGRHCDWHFAGPRCPPPWRRSVHGVVS